MENRGIIIKPGKVGIAHLLGSWALLILPDWVMQVEHGLSVVLRGSQQRQQAAPGDRPKRRSLRSHDLNRLLEELVGTDGISRIKKIFLGVLLGTKTYRQANVAATIHPKPKKSTSRLWPRSE